MFSKCEKLGSCSVTENVSQQLQNKRECINRHTTARPVPSDAVLFLALIPSGVAPWFPLPSNHALRMLPAAWQRHALVPDAWQRCSLVPVASRRHALVPAAPTLWFPVPRGNVTPWFPVHRLMLRTGSLQCANGSLTNTPDIDSVAVVEEYVQAANKSTNKQQPDESTADGSENSGLTREVPTIR